MYHPFHCTYVEVSDFIMEKVLISIYVDFQKRNPGVAFDRKSSNCNKYMYLIQINLDVPSTSQIQNKISLKTIDRLCVL